MPRHKKIIFLDIDGVLVTLRSFKMFKKSGSEAQADPACVDALNSLLEQTGAGIVVSSTWRMDGLMRMREVLAGWGVKGSVLACTPILKGSRGSEIQAWIEQWPEELERFVILDDDSDMDHLAPHLIQSKFEDGLTVELAEKAVARFSEVACPTD